MNDMRGSYVYKSQNKGRKAGRFAGPRVPERAKGSEPVRNFEVLNICILSDAREYIIDGIRFEFSGPVCANGDLVMLICISGPAIGNNIVDSVEGWPHYGPRMERQ